MNVDGGAGPDAGPEASIPRVTVSFDASAYTGITFWAMAGATAGSQELRVLFPVIVSDPRGGKCAAPCGRWRRVNYAAGSDDLASTPATFGATAWTQVIDARSAHADRRQNLRTSRSARSATVDPPARSSIRPPFHGAKWQPDGSQLVDAAPVVTGYWVDDVSFTK